MVSGHQETCAQLPLPLPETVRQHHKEWHTVILKSFQINVGYGVS